METKFKSQICTTREQSERLLALGIKKETADMVHQPIGTTPFNVWVKQEIEDDFYPAWSLHRLMEIAYTGDLLGCVALNYHERNIATYYEQVIKVIEYLINIEEFNPEYLEETICQQD